MLIYTLFKSTIVKLPPKRVIYRDFKHFDKPKFLTNLRHVLNESQLTDNFSVFYSILVSVLDEHAPCKKRVIRGNNKVYMSKTLLKEMWKRARLKNIANRSGNLIDLFKFRRQRNYVCALNRKEKKNLFSSLTLDSKHGSFWDACKPFLSSKETSSCQSFSLNHNNLLVTDDLEIANIFNSYFNNITEYLNLFCWKSHLCVFNYDRNPIQWSVCKYKFHPSILAINNKINRSVTNTFNFDYITSNDVYNVIMELKKGNGSVPLSFLKDTAEVISQYLADCINTSIKNGIFPTELKLAEIIPIFKKGDSFDKGNYRPISILPTISKVYEKILFKQINTFFQDKFSDLLCGFRKGFSTQHALIRLLQK